MKRLLYIFTSLASFIVFFIGFQLHAERQYAQVINFEQAYAQQHHQEILTIFLRLDDKQVMSELAQFLDYHTYSASSHYEVKNHELYKTNMIFFYTKNKLNNLSFFKTKEGKYIDFSTNHTSYLSSNIKDEESVDTLQFLDKKYDKGYQDTIQIRQLFSYMDIAKEKVEMPVYIICDDRQQAFEQLQSSNLYKYLSDEVEIDDEHEGVFFLSLDNRSSIILIMIVSISFFLTLCCDIVSYQKEICVRKLHGMSSAYIFKKLYRKTLGKVYGLYIFIIILCYFIWLTSFQEIQFPFLMYLGSMSVLFFVLLSVACGGGYVCILFINTSTYLKKKSHMNWVIYSTIILKVFMIVLILPSFYTGSVQGMKAVQTSLELWKYKDKLQHNLFVEGLNVEIENMPEVLHKIYEYMEEEGAIYQDFSQNMKNLQLHQRFPDKIEKFEYPFLIVNTKYLEDYILKTVQGDTIDVHHLKNHTVLVPEKYKGVDLRTYVHEYTDIVYIKNGLKVVNYYPLILDNEQRVVENPIIEVRITSDEGIDWTGSSLMLPYTKQTLEKFQTYLEKQNLINIVTLDTSKQLYIDVVEKYKDQMIQFMTIFIVYILLLIAFMYQNMYLYFTENKTFIAINYLSGKSFLQRYSSYLGNQIFVYTLSFAIGYWILHLEPLFLCIFSIGSILIQIGMMKWMVTVFERKHIVTILKGE